MAKKQVKNRSQIAENEISKTDNVKNQNNSLTDNELETFLSYTQQIMNAYSGEGYPMAFTPLMTNERLSRIGFTPKDLNAGNLKQALETPYENSELLQAYAEWLNFSEAISRRTVEYMGNLPTFDYTFVCTNPPSDRNDKEYVEDKKRLKDFLNRFDVQGEFSRVLRQALITDIYFGIFRTDVGVHYTFQQLPAQKCLITGRSADYGFLFDFNMEFFLEQGLSIDQYPEAMKKLWQSVFGKDKGLKDYDPAAFLNKRKGAFATYAQTSPLLEDGGFVCFKFNSDTFAVTPFLAPLFRDAVYKDLKRELQNNQDIIASNKILVGLIPFLKDVKSGAVKDMVAIKPDTLMKYLGFLKKGLHEAIKVSGVPFSDLKDINYTLPDKNVYTEYNKNLAGNTGVSSRLVYSADKQTAQETLLSSEIDGMLATQFYPQCAIWLSTIANTFTKKYKFKFSFEGNSFSYNRLERLETTLKLADRGLVLPQKISACLGMNIFDLMEHLTAGQEDDFRDKLYLLMNTNTKDYGENKGGRPQQSVTSESTDRNDERVLSRGGDV